jgi:hypothetical protein
MKALVVLILIVLSLLALRKNMRIIIFRNQPPRENRKKEGEVTLDTSRSKQKSNPRQDGEYVDYTEIKD